MRTALKIALFVCLAAFGSRALAEPWQAGPCGRGGLCPGVYTPLPTPTNIPTLDPAAPTPTAWPTGTLTPTPVAGAFSLRVDVGASQAYTDGQGLRWDADKAFGVGSFGFVGKAPAYATEADALGTAEPLLYRTLRQATALEFKAALPAGEYRVVLHFAEWVATADGQRRMSVGLEGQPVAADLDVHEAAGAGRAYTLAILVSVEDGELDLVLQSLAGKAMLAALELHGVVALDVPTPTPTPTEIPLHLDLIEPVNARLLETP